jgi:hypothetical protein
LIFWINFTGVKIIKNPLLFDILTGIDNHHVRYIGTGIVGGAFNTQRGSVIAIMHQYALLVKGA